MSFFESVFGDGGRGEREKMRRSYENMLSDKDESVDKLQDEARSAARHAADMERKMMYEKSEANMKLEMERDQTRQAEERAESTRNEMMSQKANADLQIKVEREQTKEAERRNRQLQQEMSSTKLDNETKLELKNQQLLVAEREKHEIENARRDEMSKKEEKFREEMKEDHREFRAMMADMYKTQATSHTKQIEHLSKGMDSIAQGLAKMSIGPGEKACSPQTVLEKPSFVMIHNFGRNEKARKLVTKDIDALGDFFENIGEDNKVEEKKGYALADVSKECGKEDYSDRDGIIATVFGPGFDMTMQDEEGPISVEEFCKPFVENRTLRKKPKIFLIHVLQRSSGETPPKSEDLSSRDVLTYYCEMPEDAYMESCRRKGSIFVRAFCEIMKKNPNDGIADILKKVQEEMMNECEGGTFTISDNLREPVRFQK